MTVKNWKLGIVGHPLNHTLSPTLQQHFMDSVGLDGEYEKLDLDVDAFSNWLDTAGWRDYDGLNITIPYKTRFQQLPMKYSDTARFTGAINTLTPSANGKWEAGNTDVLGFDSSLPVKFRQQLQGKSALIIGSGGSARAVACALLNRHVGQLFIKVRPSSYYQPTYSAIEKMKSFLGSNTRVSIVTNWDTSALRPDRLALVVNTTPVGMFSNTDPEISEAMIDESPLPLEFLQTITPRCLMYDLIYNPIQTRFLAEATALGFESKNGLEMLAHQGARAFEKWTKKAITADIIDEGIEKLKARLSENNGSKNGLSEKIPV